MKIKSDVFEEGKMIPRKYTCYGESLPLPLKILDVPLNAKSLALIVDDPDAPLEEFVHWVVWNINPKTLIIKKIRNISGAVEGNTSMGKPGWVSPCPPSGTHRYNFRLYALDTMLSLPKDSTKDELIKEMEGHILENTTLIGMYNRNEGQ